MNDCGLSAADIATLRAAVGDALGSTQQAELWLFGSRARGTHRRFSDVDLLIDARPPLSRAQLGEVRATLEASSLPFFVDVVEIAALFPPYAAAVMQERRHLASTRGRGPGTPP